MADLKLVALHDASEWGSFHTATSLAFGHIADQSRIDRTAKSFEPDRAVKAVDGDLIVGTTAATSFQLTVPGGHKIAAGGLTAVSVRSTHTGRGLLTRMIDWHFDDCRRRGEAVSILTASESSIYHRYGYGVASHIESLACADGHTVLTPLADAIARRGSTETGFLSDAIDDVMPFYDQWHGTTVGSLSRNKEFWESFASDAYTNLQPGQAWQVAFHRDDLGTIDGYATYVIKPDWGSDRVHKGGIGVFEIVDLVPSARLALWRFLTSIPLHGKISLDHSPPDEPIRLAMRDPRRLLTSAANDFLWVRILDVPAALNARSYSLESGVVIGVDGQSFGRNDGEWREVTMAPDLTCSIADLGAVYLGGVSWNTLARAGRVDEKQAGGLRRADALFRTESLPFCNSHF